MRFLALTLTIIASLALANPTPTLKERDALVACPDYLCAFPIGWRYSDGCCLPICGPAGSTPVPRPTKCV